VYFLSFDGGLGEPSEDVFVYEDRATVRVKGFAGTRLGEKDITMFFKDIVSVALEKGLKKDFIRFVLTNGDAITVAHSNYEKERVIKLKEFVESRIG